MRTSLGYRLGLLLVALVMLLLPLIYVALVASLDRDHDEFLSSKTEILKELLRDRPGDRVAMYVREAVVRGDERFEFTRVGLYRIVDGKIASIDIFESDQYGVDAFFG